MQVGKITTVTTVAATQFRSTLAQNAGESLSLDVNPLALGIRVDAILRTIEVISMEALLWELWFYARNTYNAPPTPDEQTFLGLYAFAAVGKQIGAAGLYHYHADNIYIPLKDLDQTGRVHMSLINRSAGSKTAGDAGAVRVQLGLEMALGC